LLQGRGHTSGISTAAAAATTKQSWFRASGDLQDKFGLNDRPLLTRENEWQKGKRMSTMLALFFGRGGGSTGLVNNKTSASTDINVVSLPPTPSGPRLFYDGRGRSKWFSIGPDRARFRPQKNTTYGRRPANNFFSGGASLSKMTPKHRQAIIHQLTVSTDNRYLRYTRINQ